ncbi:MAG: hypothetical protein GY823_03960 [Flavobacteriaceae bacterium]|nr:hypothetical protein [Flavobacteriaceae bacterium]
MNNKNLLMNKSSQTEPVNDSFLINLNEEAELRSVGEEAWSEETEKLAYEWAKNAKEASNAHNSAGKSHKSKHVGIGLPAVLVPIFMAPISATLAGFEGIQYANMAGFLVSGTLSAVNSFFGFDKKYQKHMDFSARYADVYSDVKYELAKARKFRIAPDRFLMRIQMKLDSLGASAPDL